MDFIVLPLFFSPQSAGAVEYDDCITVEHEKPTQNECPVYDSKLCLMVVGSARIGGIRNWSWSDWSADDT